MAAATGAVEPPTVEDGITSIHWWAGGFKGVDTKKIMDTAFTHHQPLVAMFSTQHKSHIAALSSLKEKTRRSAFAVTALAPFPFHSARRGRNQPVTAPMPF